MNINVKSVLLDSIARDDDCLSQIAGDSRADQAWDRDDSRRARDGIEPKRWVKD
jgi:hypothetical protein